MHFWFLEYVASMTYKGVSCLFLIVSNVLQASKIVGRLGHMYSIIHRNHFGKFHLETVLLK